MKKLSCLVLILSTLTLWQCNSSSTGATDTGDDDTGETTASCNSLCTDAGFESGTEEDFGGGLIECTCSGEGDGITQESCNTYCADFDVTEENSYLSTENTDNDKCVCDGTTL